MSQPEQIEKAGKEIAQNLNDHDWKDAAQSLSNYAQTLSRDDFAELTREIAKNDTRGEGIDIGAAAAVGKTRSVDRTTGKETSEIVYSYIGTDASVYLKDDRIYGATIRDRNDVAKTVLELGNIYDQSDAIKTLE